MNTWRCRMKSYIQPFERKLALEELRVLAGTQPQPCAFEDASDTDFLIATPLSQDALAARLSYWEQVGGLDENHVTTQVLRESTVNVARNGIDPAILKQILPFKPSGVPLPNRRCLRYGTHGIHEYRGKFFPQLVRSLINISGARPASILADPMSGSGTSVVEALLAGSTGLGIDMNPLSVFVGRTKCELLGANPADVRTSYEHVREVLLKGNGNHGTGLKYFEGLPESDRRYLTGWIAEGVIESLDEIALTITSVKNQAARNLMWVSLSNILRRVSWQKDDDLRVRKEIRSGIEIDPKKEFLEELGRSTRTVLAFLYQNGTVPLPPFRIEEGDARRCTRTWSKYTGEVDVIITSPPYATALPYLDTDRLSLCYLGLLSRPQHRGHDLMMIGNREVTEGLRRSYQENYASSRGLLPNSIHALIDRIDTLNNGTSVGFRRRNLPALLAKYFLDMREVIAEVRKLLKSRGLAFVVVGNNHTIAGGKRVEIPTASLLCDIARQLDFEVAPPIAMEMLVSRDIFKRNATASEEILAFRRPAQM